MNWISVKERLPEFNSDKGVLVYFPETSFDNNSNMEVCTLEQQIDARDGSKFFMWYTQDGPIDIDLSSHWCELPEKPHE